MSNIIKINKNNIDAIPFPQNGRVIYRDEKNNHFYLFVTPQKKNFYFYRKFKGKPIQIRIDCRTPEQAKKQIAKYEAMCADGINPISEKKRKLKIEKDKIQKDKNEKTFKEVFLESYIKKINNPKTKKEYIRILDIYLNSIQDKKLRDISKIEVLEIFNSLSATPYMANRVLERIKTVFNHAIKSLDIDVINPCTNIDKNKEYPRERILSKEELKKYTATCSKWLKSPDKKFFAEIFLMLLYTGQRLKAVQNMKFTEIDFYSKNWNVPRESEKNKEAHIVPLTDKAVNILKNRKTAVSSQSEYVFPSPKKKGFPVSEIKQRWKVFIDEAKISNITRHDMRRTAGSIILMETGNLRLVQKFLNHKTIATTARVYAHIWSEEYKDKVTNSLNSI